MKRLLLFLLFFPCAALAQSPKTIESTVCFQDPQNNCLANGFLILDLNQPATITSSGGQVAPTRVAINLDANGKIPASTLLWANDQLTPSGTAYLAQVENSNGLVVANYRPCPWVIIGSSPIDLAMMTCTSINASYPYGTIGPSGPMGPAGPAGSAQGFDVTTMVPPASESAVTTTGTISSGTPTLAIAAAGDWKNGQGIAVYGAGATSSAATPTACTATVVGTAGSTTINYKIARIDSLTGMSAATANITVTTANATLSYANYVKLVCPLPNSESPESQFVVYKNGASYGMMVPIWSNANNAGTWAVGTTYGLGVNYLYNGVTYNSLQAANVGNQPDTSPTWWAPESSAWFPDIGNGPGAPIYVPSAPPGAATRQALVTTILSGAGTTSLILGANAQANLTGALVYHDDSAAIVAAVNAALAISPAGGTVVLPQGTYQWANLALPASSNYMKIQFTGTLLPQTPIVLPSNYSLIGITGFSPQQGSIAPQASIGHDDLSPVINAHGASSTVVKNVGVQYAIGDIYIAGAGATNNALENVSFNTNAVGAGAPVHFSDGFGFYGHGNSFLGDGFGPSVDLTGPSAAGASRWVWLYDTFIRNHGVNIGQTTIGAGQVTQLNFIGMKSESFGTTSGPANTNVFNINTTYAGGGINSVDIENADFEADNAGTVYLANITAGSNGYYASINGTNINVTSGLFASGSVASVPGTFVNVSPKCSSETITNITCINSQSGVYSGYPIQGAALGDTVVDITTANVNVSATNPAGGTFIGTSGGNRQLSLPNGTAAIAGIRWTIKCLNPGFSCDITTTGGTQTFEGNSLTTLTMYAPPVGSAEATVFWDNTLGQWVIDHATYSITGAPFFQNGYFNKPTTVASLPSTASSAYAGMSYYVTDGLTIQDCTAGGGTVLVACESNGTTWVSTVTLAKPGPIGATTPAAGTFTTYSTATNCAVNSVSPAACGSAAAGAFVVPTTTTTYTVNTSAITTHSRIFLQPITFASDLPSSPTCVAPLLTTDYSVSGLTAATSFTMALTSTTGQTCWMYWIVN